MCHVIYAKSGCNIYTTDIPSNILFAVHSFFSFLLICSSYYSYIPSYTHVPMYASLMKIS